ncbi:uncharacterized protein PV09_00301 [Verruconis gallopava]|uniref:Biogenesis of lysosome-related organelles complex 1 subunit CNL1 n=1 Tax=Verruconis gallopava TaxID=253628 RepID=A0A0D1Y321_9PEZI|nr:uncharacterized protein PV09_00301 [Verruconis gallopava]KIW09411.1 hypothetical protein PV09_00301 [Verruconis gallopava]
MASPANSVPDTQLGLTNDEIRALRYHQQVALSQTGSSRAASQASSAGRLLLDPSSLTALSAYFDRLMYSIQQRWQSLYSQTQNATGAQYDRAGRLIEDADAAIERFEEILRQIEELQNEFEKVRRIGEIVKQYRARVEALDRRI